MNEAKKIKIMNEPSSTIDAAKMFVESGRFVDEVKLEFENGKTLFVSRSFLSMASPVFEAMFTHDLNEKLTGSVQMTGKSYENVLMFLQCISPATMTAITPTNVLNVAPLAEEYQVDVMITRCKEVIGNILGTLSSQCARGAGYYWDIQNISRLLHILRLAMALNYDDIKALVIQAISKCWHGYFCGTQRISFNDLDDDTETQQTHIANKATFSSLPDSLKIELLTNRLDLIGKR